MLIFVNFFFQFACQLSMLDFAEFRNAKLLANQLVQEGSSFGPSTEPFFGGTKGLKRIPRALRAKHRYLP